MCFKRSVLGLCVRSRRGIGLSLIMQGHRCQAKRFDSWARGANRSLKNYYSSIRKCYTGTWQTVNNKPPSQFVPSLFRSTEPNIAKIVILPKESSASISRDVYVSILKKPS